MQTSFINFFQVPSIGNENIINKVAETTPQTAYGVLVLVLFLLSGYLLYRIEKNAAIHKDELKNKDVEIKELNELFRRSAEEQKQVLTAMFQNNQGLSQNMNNIYFAMNQELQALQNLKKDLLTGPKTKRSDA